MRRATGDQAHLRPGSNPEADEHLEGYGLGGDQDSKGRHGFIYLAKVLVLEMPFTASLFALSSPMILLGTIAGIEWLLVFGILVSFAALLTGMFLE